MLVGSPGIVAKFATEPLPVSHVAFYNLVRVHETLRATPAMALGIADRAWSIGDLLDAALAAT